MAIHRIVTEYGPWRTVGNSKRFGNLGLESVRLRVLSGAPDALRGGILDGMCVLGDVHRVRLGGMFTEYGSTLNLFFCWRKRTQQYAPTVLRDISTNASFSQVRSTVCGRFPGGLPPPRPPATMA